jgi:hypothetical protein
MHGAACKAESDNVFFIKDKKIRYAVERFVNDEVEAMAPGQGKKLADE